MSFMPGVPRPAPDGVWRAAIGDAPHRVALMLRLAAEAGLRRGEIARVHASDVGRDRAGFTLLVHGKGGRERLIPVPDALGSALVTEAAGGWVFPKGEQGHLTQEWVGELCTNALPRPWTLHTLRHSFATRAYAGSRDLRAVQLLLGHSSPAVTQRYVAVSDAALRAAMVSAAPAAAVRVESVGLLVGTSLENGSPG
jgi:integrase